MNIRTFAFVAENEVFFTFTLSPISNGFDRMCEALNNNPTFVNCTSHADASLIGNGWTWDGTNFNPPAQKEDTMPAVQNYIKFAIIVDGVVKGWMGIHPDNTIQIAGLSSNPQVVEVTDLADKPSVGWTWDGAAFNPPA